MLDILKAPPEKDENLKIFSYLEASPTAQYYDIHYSKAGEVKKPELFDQVKQAQREKGTAYRIMENIVGWLEKTLPPDAVVIELGGGMHQQRSANAYKRFKNYFPLDIGYSNIKAYTEKFGREGFVADATRLPFKDQSIDCILTHTFLEHPIGPEKVVAEIVRVLKPGGIVVHNDAWFCRWWQHYGVVGLKRVANMSFKEKMIWLGAKITEFPLFRIPPIVFRRLILHFLEPATKPLPLRYKKLQPNYELQLGCDEDAASRIDPVDVIRFYESRGFTLVSPVAFVKRMLYPNRYIALKKPVANS